MLVTLVPFLIFMSLWNLFLGVIWQKSSWYNLLLKMIFILASIWGGLLVLHTLGFIIMI